ncbi:MAG: sugar phosphate nucleotidyltransferase [archaeon]
MKQKISITIEEKTLSAVDEIIDNIYIRNRSAAIEQLINSALGEKRTAVILIGGPEESLKISDTEYRVTASIGDSTVIEHAVKKLRENEFKNIFAIARHNVISDIFKSIQNGSKYGVNVQYIEEENSSGTAESLRLVKGKINSSFLVVYGDIIFDMVNLDELWNSHIKKSGIATLLLTTTPTPNKKGVVKIEGSTILEFTQKPTQSDIFLGFSSIFVAQPEILEYSGASLEDNIFPLLAKKHLLLGHMSANKELHIHTSADVEKVKKILQNPYLLS